MLTKFANRIAAAVHTLLDRHPVRLAAKDIDIIVERVSRIKENPLQRVDVSVNPAGQFDAEAARKLIREHTGQGSVLSPLEPFHKGGLVGSMTREQEEHAAIINGGAFKPQSFESAQAEQVNDMPAACELPPLLPMATWEEQKKANTEWLWYPGSFEEALSRGIALVLAGRLESRGVAMYLRSEFGRAMGVQSRIGRWLSPNGLAEIAAHRMNVEALSVDKLERLAKRGTLRTAEQMHTLLEQRSFGTLAPGNPAIVNVDMPLDGVTFVLTGGLPGMTRDDAKARVEALGGVVAGAVNRHPIILVRGEGISTASAKLQKAWFFNHPVISTEQFEWLLKYRENVQGKDIVDTVCTAANCEQALANPSRGQ